MVKRELSNVKVTCLWVHDGEFIFFFLVVRLQFTAAIINKPVR